MINFKKLSEEHMSLWWLKRVKISAEFLNNVFGYAIFCINITMFHD